VSKIFGSLFVLMLFVGVSHDSFGATGCPQKVAELSPEASDFFALPENPVSLSIKEHYLLLNALKTWNFTDVSFEGESKFRLWLLNEMNFLRDFNKTANATKTNGSWFEEMFGSIEQLDTKSDPDSKIGVFLNSRRLNEWLVRRLKGPTAEDLSQLDQPMTSIQLWDLFVRKFGFSSTLSKSKKYVTYEGDGVDSLIIDSRLEITEHFDGSQKRTLPPELLRSLKSAIFQGRHFVEPQVLPYVVADLEYFADLVNTLVDAGWTKRLVSDVRPESGSDSLLGGIWELSNGKSSITYFVDGQNYPKLEAEKISEAMLTRHDYESPEVRQVYSRFYARVRKIEDYRDLESFLDGQLLWSKGKSKKGFLTYVNPKTKKQIVFPDLKAAFQSFDFPKIPTETKQKIEAALVSNTDLTLSKADLVGQLIP